MIDQWNEILRCPRCGSTGLVSLSQLDSTSNMPSVDSISDGLVQTLGHRELGRSV
jgi:hypothetical protein